MSDESRCFFVPDGTKMFFFIDVPSVENIVARRVVHQVVPRLLKYSSKVVWLKILNNFLSSNPDFKFLKKFIINPDFLWNYNSRFQWVLRKKFAPSNLKKKMQIFFVAPNIVNFLEINTNCAHS